MRRLIAHNFSTLDGYAATTEGHPFSEIMTGDDGREIERHVIHFLEEVDLLVFGKNTYSLFAQYWPVVDPQQEILADRLNGLPKVVCSSSLEQAPWGNHTPVQILPNTLEGLRELKRQPGKDMLIFGSLSLCGSLLQEGLLDEFHLYLAPFVLGGGIKIFGDKPIHAQFQLKEFQRLPQGVLRLEYLSANGFNKERILDDLAYSAKELMDLLESQEEGTLLLKPGSDGWSAIEVGEHLLKSYNLFHILNGKVAVPIRSAVEYLPLLRSNMLDYRFKAQADIRLHPDEATPSKKAIIEGLKNELNQLLEFGHQEDLRLLCLEMEFPGLTHLTRLEWLGFTAYHTRRHVWQIREVLQKAMVSERPVNQAPERL